MKLPWMRPLGLVIFFSGLLLGACREKPVATPGGPSPDSPPGEKGEAGISDADFLGLSREAGEKLADQRRTAHRVVSIDGEPRPVTMDYREDRVNFEIEGGKIVKVTRG